MSDADGTSMNGVTVHAQSTLAEACSADAVIGGSGVKTREIASLALISLAKPWISATVRWRWFALPEVIALMAIPLMTVVALVAVRKLLDTRLVRGPLCWLPFVLLILVFVLGFLGLAYSIYPFVVIDRMTIWQAASSPAALAFGAGGRRASVSLILFRCRTNIGAHRT